MAISCAATFSYSIGAGAPASKPLIKIGVILPLTGNNAHLGEPLRDLIKYKAEHFPKDSRFEYKALFEDDQLEARQSLLAAHRLVELEHVDILMTYFSGPGGVVSLYATQKKIPHFMWNFNTKVLDGVFNFDHISSTATSAQCWTDYAQKKGYKKVAFLIHRNPGAMAVQKALEDCRPHSTLNWVDEEYYNQGERDFRVTLYKLKEKNPDLLYLYGFEPELPIILRQMREIGWKIPVTTITMFDMIAENPMIEGAWYVGSDSPTPQYREWYNKTFKVKNASYGAGVYDDYLSLIYKACESYRGQGKPTGEEIAAYLRGIKDFDGACGKISCNEKGIFETKPALLMIKNGTVEQIAR